MDLGILSSFSEGSPLWVFGADRDLTEPEVARIREELGAFARAWGSHNVPLRAACEVIENRFVVVIVDESQGASGCAIDKLFQAVGAIERKHGVKLLDSSAVWFRDGEGRITSIQRVQFSSRAFEGSIDAATHVFEVGITNRGELESKFEQRAGDSWHSRYLPKEVSR